VYEVPVSGIDRSCTDPYQHHLSIVTKVSAITTASGVNGMVSPNQSSRYLPMKPVRPNVS
jgi:hypothetical protein